MHSPNAVAQPRICEYNELIMDDSTLPAAHTQSTEDVAPQVDDRVLASALTMRDQEALLLLYQRYGALVYGMALRVLGQPASAEEVTQDVFLKLWNQPSRWDPALGRLSSWLLTTTRNAAIDRLRQENRHWRALDDAPLSDENASTAGVADDPLWADGQILQQILTTLPYQQRQLVELAFYGGHTHSELATMLDLPLGTVKTRLRAAIHALREGWIQANTRAASPGLSNPAQGVRQVHG